MAELAENMVGTAAGTMGVSQEDIPLAMRLASASPGPFTAAAFMTYRGSNTLLEGGRFDYLEKGKYRRLKAGRVQKKYRVLDASGNVTDPNVRQFYGGGRGGLLGRRAARKVSQAGTASAGLSANFNARASAASFRPTALRRHGSLTSFADPSMGIYSPYSISGLLGRSSKFQKMIGLRNVPEGQAAFGPGLLSFMSAQTRMDRLERKALAGNARAQRKVLGFEKNIRSLAKMNNPAMLAPTFGSTGARSVTYAQAAAMTPFQRGGLTATQYAAKFNAPKATVSTFLDDAMGSAARVVHAYGSPGVGAPIAMGQVGVHGNLMASAAPTQGLQKVLGFARGAAGFAETRGLQGMAAEGANAAVRYMDDALSKINFTAKTGQKVLETGLFKNLGVKGVTDLLTKGGRSGRLVVGARAASMAIPGLQVLGAMSLLYDLGNMAGQVVKSGINLARDAAKSMQGSINKPLFGMGYRDTEAAATSRQRGVMAIQNSRLNARSMLGSEAGMLAARYG